MSHDSLAAPHTEDAHTQAGMRGHRLPIGERTMQFTLSLGLGIFVPGSGALAYAGGHPPSWIPIRASLANQQFFAQIAVIVFGLTLALMLEMRFAGLMKPREERERRMVFRWFVVGGFLTTACAVLGACESPATQPSHTLSRSVIALFGASIYGTFIIGALVLCLTAMLPDGFKKLAEREDRSLVNRGAKPRARKDDGAHYARQALPASLGAVALLTAGYEEWYLAIPALLLACAWLLHAWHSRENAPRADELVPLHPITFLSIIVFAISLAFLAHHALAFIQPGRTKTATMLYAVVSGMLSSGYVAFASDRRLERQTGLLPSLHTVGAWCAIVGLAGIGLGGSLLGGEHAGGWFAFWITAISTPAMLTQAYLVRSASIRV